jgi:ferredoxin-NADP reductase
MNATLARIATERPHIRTFYFQPEQPYHYVAGQFADLTIRHENADDRGAWRQFTLSSSPTEPLLAVTVKFDTMAGSTFKKSLLSLQPGDKVNVAQAMGDFVLPLDTELPLVWIAGGIGITPFRSMAKWLADAREKRDIQLLHIAKPEDSRLFESEIQAAGVSRHEVSDLDDALHHVLQTVHDISERQYFIAGPESMVSSAQKALAGLGVQPYQVITDTFLGYK